MKRRAVTVPVLSWAQLAFLDAASISGFFLDLWHPFWPVKLFSSVLTVWELYSLTRLMFFKAEPLTLAVGKKPVEIAPAVPEMRQPLAFPPEPHQCFVCGTYDQNRQDVFGDATHATCLEWLGNWPIPNWIIYCREYGLKPFSYSSGFYKMNLCHFPGTTPRQQIIDYCFKELFRYTGKDLFAELEMPDGSTLKFNIPDRRNSEH